MTNEEREQLIMDDDKGNPYAMLIVIFIGIVAITVAGVYLWAYFISWFCNQIISVFT